MGPVRLKIKLCILPNTSAIARADLVILHCRYLDLQCSYIAEVSVYCSTTQCYSSSCNSCINDQQLTSLALVGGQSSIHNCPDSVQVSICEEMLVEAPVHVDLGPTIAVTPYCPVLLHSCLLELSALPVGAAAA